MTSDHGHSRIIGDTIHRARRYDLLTKVVMLGKERALREMTVAMAGIEPGEEVLDVGCGTGGLPLAAEDHAGPAGGVYGIDAAPEMIEVARGKAGRAGSDANFQVGLVQEIPFPDDTFDVVLSSLMLHHVPDDVKPEAFAEIRRVLKPGGRVFAVDFEPPASHVLRHLFALVLSHGMMRVDVREYVPTMEEAGFERVETGTTAFRYVSYVRGREPEQ